MCKGVRNYQILNKSERGEGKDTSLIEVGPRFVLVPIRIFNGSFGGATIYQNASFVSPNEERSTQKKFKGYAR
jgi:ribosome biogenesis protein BRX1